ncbi:hypothetical protein BJ085DRAFT_35377 [Dimargaris cristalligena]|uniref:Carrier domain-containing protein n=1 Tax=Dimargaris cristalligena TaxID=215637 RepID=A0A4P9ZPV5_9FUNG|nr:hypothetical protein BJ085DRAFT_35377 [Dimargaris cristalligena]|eukprot:RKP35484.1 hypothetical protein BJ085DRAFT_35377 [Dimargaris cristalligena]
MVLAPITPSSNLCLPVVPVDYRPAIDLPLGKPRVSLSGYTAWVSGVFSSGLKPFHRDDFEHTSQLATAIILSRYYHQPVAAFAHRRGRVEPVGIIEQSHGSLQLVLAQMDPDTPVSPTILKNHDPTYPPNCPNSPSPTVEVVLHTDLGGTSVGHPMSEIDQRHGQPKEAEVDPYIADLLTKSTAHLVISCTLHQGYAQVTVSYGRALYRDSAVAEFSSQFKTVFLAVAQAFECDQPILVREIAWVSDQERTRLLDFSQMTKPIHGDYQPFHYLFGDCAKRFPHQLALVHGGEEWTYGQLDYASSELARTLVNQYGARPEVLFALLIPKSIAYNVAILAVLKSGAAYVPLDPDYPFDRIQYILTDSDAAMMIVADSVLGKVPGQPNIPIMVIDPFVTKPVFTEPSDFQPLLSAPNDLAYVIYTSGTTGRPKGVLVEHLGVANISIDPCLGKAYGPGRRAYQTGSVAFDGILVNTLRCLCTGSTVVVPTDCLLDDLQHVNTGFLVTSFLSRLNPQDAPEMDIAVIGGESLLPKQQAQWAPHCTLANHYGPTEITVYCNVALIGPDDDITIGRPIQNVFNLVVDDDLQLVPVGVPGELLIGGVGVARGYQNLPELTAKKFISNPLGEGRVYRTGDYVRWLPSGTIELIGRIDNQIKLRGYRIEIEEIEKIASQFLGLKQCIAVVIQESLVIYASPETIDSIGLLDFLRGRLPKQMVPELIMPVEGFIYTTSGKLDQEELRRVWGQILQLDPDRISTTDHFFRIGGDSISAILLVSKSQQLGYQLTVPLIYQYPELQQLAQHTEKASSHQTNGNAAYQEQVQGEVALVPSQYWLGTVGIRNPHHFNQSLTLKVNSKANISLAAISDALVALANHHDILRARFQPDNDGQPWVQSIPTARAISTDFLLLEETVSTDDYADFILRVQSSLNLSTGPMLAAALIHDPDSTSPFRLFITIHHILVDLVAWRILIEDLNALLQGASLPPKTLPFQAWASQLDDYAATLLADIWPTQVDSDKPIRDFRALHPPHELDATRTQAARLSTSFEFDSESTQALLIQLVPQLRVTPRDLLLATFTQAFATTIGLDQVTFCMEGHGREPWLSDQDITRTVGWFTAIYPLVLRVQLDQPLLGLLHHTKEALQKIPMKGFPYSLLKHMPGVPAEERAKLEAKSPDRLDARFNYSEHPDSTGGGLSDDILSIEWSDHFGLHDFAPQDTVMYDIDIMPTVVGDSLRLIMEYNPLVYCRSVVNEIMTQWRQSLSQLANDINQSQSISLEPILTQYDFAHLQLSASELQGIINELHHRRIPLDQVEDLLPCIALQSGLLTGLSTDSTTYLVQIVFQLHGPLNVDRLLEAWQAVSQQHTILRTVFLEASSRQSRGYIQAVLRSCPTAWTISDLPLKSLDEFLTEDHRRGFTLQDHMIRNFVFPTIDSQVHDVIITFHHSLCDGWSLHLLLQAWMETYHLPNLLISNPSASFTSIVHHVRLLDSDMTQAFWIDYLKGAPSTPAPLLYPGYIGLPGSAAYFTNVRIAREQLTHCSQKFGVTLATLFRAAFALVLGHLLDQDEVVFGVTLSGRNLGLPGIDRTIGPCTNTLPLRVRMGHCLIVDWLQALHQGQMAMVPFEHSLLTDISKWASAGRSGPLFQAILGFENFPALVVNPAHSLVLSALSVHEFTEYPLAIDFIDGTEYVKVKLLYDTSIYSEKSAIQVVDMIHLVLTQILEADINYKTSPKQPLLGYRDTADVVHILGPASQKVVINDRQIHLGTLVQALTKAGAQSPRCLVLSDDRLVVLVSNSTEADLIGLKTTMTPPGIPATLMPDVIISTSAFPHVIELDDQLLPHFAQAYLATLPTRSTQSLSEYEWWLMVVVNEIYASSNHYSAVTIDTVPLMSTSRIPLAQLDLLQYRIFQKFGIAVGLGELAKHTEIRTLAPIIQSIVKQGTNEQSPDSTVEDNDITSLDMSPLYTRTMPVTIHQQRVWSLSRLESPPFAFYHHCTITSEASLQLEEVQRAIDRLATVFESLRCRFISVRGALTCHVLPQVRTEVLERQLPSSQVFDGDQFNVDAPQFDLNQGVLVRFDLYQLPVATTGSSYSAIVIRVHEIFGSTSEFDEIVRALTNQLVGQPSNLPDKKLTRAGKSNEPFEVDLDYWCTLLQNPPAELAVLTDRPRPLFPSFLCSLAETKIEQRLFETIQTQASKESVMGYGIWSSLFATFLLRLTGQTDLIMDIVTPASENGDTSVDKDTLSSLERPLRVKGNMALDFPEVVRQLTHQIVDSRLHVLPSMDILAPHLSLEGQHRISGLSRTSVAFDHPIGPENKSTIVHCVRSQSPRTMFPYDIQLVVDCHSRTPVCQLRFNQSLFNVDTANRLLQNFLAYAHSVVVAHQPWSTASLVCPTEASLILDKFALGPPNSVTRDSPCLNVLDLFLGMVQKYPDRVATEIAKGTYTYAQLSQRVFGLVERLQRAMVQPRDKVGVIVANHPDAVMCMLAVWSVGAVYVPVDHKLPTARQKYIVDTAGCTCVVNASRVDSEWCEVITIDDLANVVELTTNIASLHPNQPTDLAYIVFTSGSTGLPKGVMVEHRSLLNMLTSPTLEMLQQPGTRTMNGMAAGFDVFFLNTLLPLCYGSTLVFYGDDLPGTLKTVQQTILLPSIISTLNPQDYTNLNSLLVGGEHLPRELANQWSAVTNFYNVYGPTEATIACLMTEVPPSGCVPIGRPMADYECYILDENLRLVPIGAVGEICIGGVGVALGYINRLDLNLTKFADNSFTGQGKVYRTGDLGRWLPNGQVVCLGRMDSQVKLRGFRIELDEIRSVLMRQTGVQDCAVFVHDQFLVGYVFSDSTASEDVLRASVADQLPSYMVPSYILGLPNVPLTNNGKCDTQFLQNHFADHLATQRQRSSLLDSLSEEGQPLSILMQSLGETLGLPLNQINPDLSFVKIGGDSILAIQVSSKCRQLGFTLPTSALLGSGPLRDVIKKMSLISSASEKPSQFHPVEYCKEFSLTPIQQGFFDHPWSNPSHFNQSFALELTRPLAVTELIPALLRLINAHDMLRCQFTQEPTGHSDQWSQQILPPFAGLPIPVAELSTSVSDLSQQLLTIQSSLDINQGHHLAAGLITLLDDNELVDKAKHSVSSGNLIYPQVRPRASFLQLTGSDCLTLNTQANTQCQSIILDTALSSAILKPDTTYVQPLELMLAGLFQALHSISQGPSITVFNESHGRYPWQPSLDPSRTVGWFTSMVPCQIQVDANTAILDFLKQAKQALRSSSGPQGLQHGLYQLSSHPQSMSSNERPYSPLGVCFNYLDPTVRDEALMKHGQYHWTLRPELTANLASCDLSELRPQILEVVGSPTPGGLTFMVYYCPQVIPTSTIESLLDCVRQALKDIVQYLDLSQYPSLWTPSDFPNLNTTIPELAALETELATVGLTAHDVEDLYPMLPMQQGMWTATAKDPAEYLVQLAFTVNGVSGSDQLQTATRAVVGHHAILRTVFVTSWSNGYCQGVQVVTREPRFGWYFVNEWSDVGASSEEDFLQVNLENGFKPNESLLRIYVKRLAPNSFRYLLTIHHALIDGWSIGILLNQLRSHLQGNVGQNPSLSASFHDYVSYIQNSDKT